MIAYSETRSFLFDFEIEFAPIIVPLTEGRGLVTGRLRTFAEEDLMVSTHDQTCLVLSWSAYYHDEAALVSNTAFFGKGALEPLLWHSFQLTLPRVWGFRALHFRFICPSDDRYDSKIQTVQFQSEAQVLQPLLFNTEVNAFEYKERPNEEIARSSFDVIKDELPSSAFKSTPASNDTSKGRCLFDVTDLYQYWGHSIRPTGIQRVQIELLRVMLDCSPETFRFSDVCAIHYSVEHRGWRLLENSRLIIMFELTRRANLATGTWEEHRQSLSLTSRSLEITTGDVIINLGSSWWIPDYHYKIRELQRSIGLKYLPFLHDVIPLATPEHCADGLIDAFKLWFRDVIETADHVVVNSKHSLADIKREAEKLTSCRPNFTVVTLDAFTQHPEVDGRTGLLERLGLDQQSFVLCVGTLEGRKNHALLLQIWRRLLRSISHAQLPKLVLVGKPGFMWIHAETILRRFPDVSEHVLIISQISDVELAELYRECQFTVFPSFYEGWGLPLIRRLFPRLRLVATYCCRQQMKRLGLQ